MKTQWQRDDFELRAAYVGSSEVGAAQWGYQFYDQDNIVFTGQLTLPLAEQQVGDTLAESVITGLLFALSAPPGVQVTPPGSGEPYTLEQLAWLRSKRGAALQALVAARMEADYLHQDEQEEDE